MKLTERGAASLNSTVCLSRALISLTALNSGVRGMLTPAGGFAMRSKVAFMSADMKSVPSWNWTQVKRVRLAVLRDFPAMRQIGDDGLATVARITPD